MGKIKLKLDEPDYESLKKNYFEKALTVQKDNPEAHNELGKMYY